MEEGVGGTWRAPLLSLRAEQARKRACADGDSAADGDDAAAQQEPSAAAAADEGEIKRARTDGGPESDGGDPAAAPAMAEMTASQVANMVCEMLAAVRQGAPGMDKMLKMCFSESMVVSTLAQRHKFCKSPIYSDLI
jgi:hypothetical protein